jgi:DNA-binding response OmpR family regulator
VFANNIVEKDNMEKILIIDDDVETTNLLDMILNMEGYNVSSVNIGPDGINAANEFNPDLIILDLMMPDMDGLQICRDLRKDSDYNKTPIIVFTAIGNEALMENVINSGANDYLNKPMDKDDLLSMIEKWIKKQK